MHISYHLIVGPYLSGGLQRVHLGPIWPFHGFQKWFSMFYSWLELRRSGTRYGTLWRPLWTPCLRPYLRGGGRGVVYHTMHTWITRRCTSPVCVRYETTLDGTLQMWSRMDPLDLFGPLGDHLETIWTRLRPCGDLWKGVWRPLVGYMYTLYNLRPRGRSEPDQKRVLRRGPVHKKRVLRGPKRVQMDPSGSLLESIPKWSHT